MPGSSIIVYGARGGVGRAAALEAHGRGAHVYLAMRDPTQAVKGINTDDSGFTRIQADLTDTDSVKRAVAESKAKVVFSYVIFGQIDLVRQSFVAMKEAGISHVVLLSSYSVQPSVEKTLADGDAIGVLHAQYEQAILDAGLTSTALRPAFFASNLLMSEEGLKKGELSIYQPDSVNDYIAPENIGMVAGARLAAAMQAGGSLESEVIPLCGPQLLSLREAWGIVAKLLGRELPIKALTREEFIAASHYPPAVTEGLAKRMDAKSDKSHTDYPADVYPEPFATNVKKYTGRDPIKFEEWIQMHKDDPRWHN